MTARPRPEGRIGVTMKDLPLTEEEAALLAAHGFERSKYHARQYYERGLSTRVIRTRAGWEAGLHRSADLRAALVQIALDKRRDAAMLRAQADRLEREAAEIQPEGL